LGFCLAGSGGRDLMTAGFLSPVVADCVELRVDGTEGAGSDDSDVEGGSSSAGDGGGGSAAADSGMDGGDVEADGDGSCVADGDIGARGGGSSGAARNSVGVAGASGGT